MVINKECPVCEGVGKYQWPVYAHPDNEPTISHITKDCTKCNGTGRITSLYDILLADPPWRYSFSKSKSRRIENQYPTMTLKEICDLQVPAKDNAVLYLWATAPKLLEALEVMKAWGFTYKTHAVWDKEKIGMGYWFRGRHELLLVGVKGKFSPPEPKQRTDSVFQYKRGKHSKKPEAVRDLITQWYPTMDKIELFARERVPGWDAFGDEI